MTRWVLCWTCSRCESEAVFLAEQKLFTLFLLFIWLCFMVHWSDHSVF